MGTRCLVRVFDGEDDKEIVTLYRQFDGYPDGMGKDLIGFLRGLQVVNGIDMRETRRIANGYGCLAAQLVTYLKGTTVGNVYLYPPVVKDCGEEYEYQIRGDPGPATNGIRQPYFCAFSVGHDAKDKRTTRKLFKGNVSQAARWLSEKYNVSFEEPVTVVTVPNPEPKEKKPRKKRITVTTVVGLPTPINLPDPGIVIPR